MATSNRNNSRNKESQQHFYMAGMPGTLVVIDGCHIAISKPHEYPNSYKNRRGYASIILQGICYDKARFIDVFTGCCGSMHNARVWAMSDIRQAVDENPIRYFPEDCHIVGDAAYGLSYNLLTPYRDNGHLNNVQRNYNLQHSRTRVIIKRAFGILLCRFRSLKFLYMNNTYLVPSVIMACCILYNICIDMDDLIEIDRMWYRHADNNDQDDVVGPANHNTEAGEKRDIIVHMLFQAM